MAQFIKGKQIATQSVTINGVDGNVVGGALLGKMFNRLSRSFPFFR